MQGNTEREKPKKGAALQFFGMVLLSLGLLNAMLALKGALTPDWFIYVLIVLGSALLAAGVWRSGIK
ncbi:MAG: hypothetical protein HY884_04480 [Deltaproteobacteria bacterium]|nr:hypothetical protein [Deltaproteobacteria bacterium]